jgi:hypothetical protein
MLQGTDKPYLSLTEEEDEGLNDDDDVEELVSLGSLWGREYGGRFCTLSCFRQADKCPQECVCGAGWPGETQVD